MTKPEFKNTFAPHVVRGTLTVDQIIQLLSHAMIKYEDLPTEVKNSVDHEMEKRSS